MALRETVRPLTTGQMKELSAALTESIPSTLTFDAATHWIGNKRLLGAALRSLLINVHPPFQTFIHEVNYDENEWRRPLIGGGVHPEELSAGDFPVRGTGRRSVMFRLRAVTEGMTFIDVLKAVEADAARRCDRAEAGTFARWYPTQSLIGNPIIALTDVMVGWAYFIRFDCAGSGIVATSYLHQPVYDFVPSYRPGGSETYRYLSVCDL